MDLSKVFGIINHDLLLAKRKAYGSSKNALTLMCNYLKNSKQKVVINNSTTKAVVAGVPQGFIDGPLLFSIFINNPVLFIQYTIIENYADDSNIISVSGNNKKNLKKLLLSGFQTLPECFPDNYMIIILKIRL